MRPPCGNINAEFEVPKSIAQNVMGGPVQGARFYAGVSSSPDTALRPRRTAGTQPGAIDLAT
jgi:hypothetical protein